MTVGFKAFTCSYPKLSNILLSKVLISIEFDPKVIKEHRPAHHEFNAIWDTGATNTVISHNVVAKLDLKPIDLVRTQTTGGVHLSNVYYVNIVLPNNVGFSRRRVTEGNIGGFDVLIGMDIITKGDLAISNFNQKTTFTFRIPSLEKFDFTQSSPKETPFQYKKKKIRPNDLCPCGSGKKYKKCHSVSDQMKLRG